MFTDSLSDTGVNISRTYFIIHVCIRRDARYLHEVVVHFIFRSIVTHFSHWVKLTYNWWTISALQIQTKICYFNRKPWCGAITFPILKDSSKKLGKLMQTFRIGCSAKSSVIDNDDTNKQWPVVTVVLYNKNMFELMK